MITTFLMLILVEQAASQSFERKLDLIAEMSSEELRSTIFSGTVRTCSSLFQFEFNHGQFSSFLLFDVPEKRLTSDNVVEEIIQAGARSLPDLVKAVSDKRPTKLAQRTAGSVILPDLYRVKSSELVGTFTYGDGDYITVGEVCLFAWGQIYNRSTFNFNRNDVHLISYDKLIEGLSLGQHGTDEGALRKSLVFDVLHGDDYERMVGAFLRLKYYWPGSEIPVLVKRLQHPIVFFERGVQEYYSDFPNVYRSPNFIVSDELIFLLAHTRDDSAHRIGVEAQKILARQIEDIKAVGDAADYERLFFMCALVQWLHENGYAKSANVIKAIGLIHQINSETARELATRLDKVLDRIPTIAGYRIDVPISLHISTIALPGSKVQPRPHL